MTEEYEYADPSRCRYCGHRLGLPVHVIVFETFTLKRYLCEKCRQESRMTYGRLVGRRIETVPIKGNLL